MKWLSIMPKSCKTSLLNSFLVSKDSKFPINSHNLSLIMKSESIRGTIYQLMENSMIPRQPFFVTADTLLKIDDLVDFPLSDIAQPAPYEYLTYRLFKFKTENQLRNLESLLGESISTLIRPFWLFRCSSRLWLSHQIWPTSSAWTL